MLGSLRPYLRELTTTVARPIARTGIRPNALSFLAVPIAGAAGLLEMHRLFGPALVLAALALSIDLIDGRVAELQGRKSLFGNYFETLVDRMVDILLMAPLVLHYPVASVLALSLSMLVSYAKPRVGLVIITDNRDWPALGERPERVLLLLLGLFLSAFGLQVAGMDALELCLWITALLTLAGTVQRIVYARNLIEEAEREGTVLPYLREGRER